jgi:Tfp pilus assembly protein PilX
VTRREGERGSALIIVMLSIAVLLVLGAALLRDVTGEGDAARHERNREAAFGLAESGFNGQIAVLATVWPTSATRAYPSACTTSAAPVYGCPDSAAMAAAVSQVAAGDAVVWSVAVRDNGASSTAWAEGMLTTEPTWDANGDGIPANVITAGWFGTGNEGNGRLVDTVGTAAQPAPVWVRCTAPAPSTCLDYPPNRGQISPDTTRTGYTGGSAVTARVLADVVARAQRDGTYHASGCPTSLAGAVVVIAGPVACAYSANDVWNSAASPGMLVILQGSVALLGTSRYHGVIYSPNQRQRQDAVVTVTGNAVVQGSVFVDGPGGVVLDGSAQVVYDPVAIGSQTTLVSPVLVKGTWRQL